MAPDDRPIEHAEPAAPPPGDPAGPASGIAADAFGYVPESTSRIGGLGGDRPPDDPFYAFHTIYMPFEPGPMRAVLRFDDLVAGVGELMIRVFSYTERRTNKVREDASTTVFLREITVSGRPFAIDFTAEAGIQYAIVGHIYSPTDARAAGLSIEIGPARGSPEEAAPPAASAFGQGTARRMFALRSVRRPSIAFPVSQPYTPAQLAEEPCRQWLGRVPALPAAAHDQWEIAYILQSLQVYGRLQSGAHGLGFGPPGDPVAPLLREMGCAATSAEPAGLEDVHPSVVRATASGGRHVGFDFLWSRLTGSTLRSDVEIRDFVSRTGEYLALGGLAIHIFAAMPSPSRAAHGEDWIDYNGIGKIALDSVANGHIVAQLKTDRDPAHARGGSAPVPFGLIIRKSSDTVR